MHVFEAAVELAETSGDERWAELARKVARLFVERFFDEKTGTLAEYFDQDWNRMPGVEGRIIEPGHHLEWSWLLHRAEPLVGFPVRDHARALYDFAQRWGPEPSTGLIYDEVLDDGTVHKPDHRTWPQTEALKAHLAAFEHDGVDTRDRIAPVVSNLLDRFLAPAPEGAWIDHIRTDGSPRVQTIPASTLYHVLLAFAELLRLEPALRARSAA